MASASNPNANQIPETPLYDNVNHQIVAAEAGNAVQDGTTGNWYAPELVDDSPLQGPVSVTVTSPLTASADNSITFSKQVRTVLLHNQSAVNVPYEHDQTASAVSPYLAPGQLVYVDVHTTVLHVFPSNALPVNAASGLIVRGWS